MTRCAGRYKFIELDTEKDNTEYSIEMSVN